MTDIEAAYIAGLFDGEGSVSVVQYRATKNDGKYRRAQLRITNTHRGVLEYVAGVTGVGGVHLTHKPRNANWKPCFQYIVHGRPVLRLLSALMPYLIVKKAAAQSVIDGPNSGRA